MKNHVNINKDTLFMEPDQYNPGYFLVSFTFDATSHGSITIMYFAEETWGGKLIAVKEGLLKQITEPFKEGLCQKYRQPSGSGIEISMLEDTRPTYVYPLVLKVDVNNGEPISQITLACFERRRSRKGGYKVKVMKQILWIDGEKRYEQMDVHGTRNASDEDLDGYGSDEECVICFSQPPEMIVLPCRHMCMCWSCASRLYRHNFMSNCPMCRHPID